MSRSEWAFGLRCVGIVVAVFAVAVALFLIAPIVGELFTFAAFLVAVVLFVEVLRKARLQAEDSTQQLRALKDQLERESKACKQSGELFRLAVDNDPGVFIIYDAERRIQFVNAAGLKLSGRPESDFLGNRDDEVWPPEITETYLPTLKRAMETRTLQTGEITLTLPNGKHYTQVVNYVPVLNEKGEIRQVLGITHDITERKRTEETLREGEQRLRLALEASGMGWWDWDLTTDTLELDTRCKALLALPTSADVDHDLILARMHPDDLPRYREILRRALTSPGDHEVEFRVLWPDGSVHWLLNRGRSSHDPAGQPVRLMGTSMDITERKKAAEELLTAKEAAEEASRAKNRFLANVSHELRTPMNAILGMTELALQESVNPVLRDYLETVKDSADVLLALLNEILDLARMESGKFALEPTAFRLREVLNETIKTLAVRAHQKGLELICDLPDEIPDELVGDPLRLRQILVNLVGNAIKFTERGHVAVRVDVESQSAEEIVLKLAVEDTGIGIAPEDCERIFAPFVQAGSSVAAAHGGTGLGLSIVSSLIALMGGRIWVDSQPGRGSTFFVTMRLRRSTEPLPETLPESLNAGMTRASRKLRVLLAEDAAANRKLVTYLLNKRGHTVETADNGQQAVEMVRQSDYDVVLMDVQMPVMDGLQATAAIRGLQQPRKARLPIVAMTAHAMRGDGERFLDAGMDAYLAKPVKAVELLELVERLARNPDGSSRDEVAQEAGSVEEEAPAASLSVFDPDDALARCFGKPDVLQEMVDFFFLDTPPMLEAMRAGLHDHDPAAIARAAHKLRGTLVYLGAHAAAEASRHVEQFAQDGDLTAAAEAVEQLQRDLHQLELALEEYRSRA